MGLPMSYRWAFRMPLSTLTVCAHIGVSCSYLFRDVLSGDVRRRVQQPVGDTVVRMATSNNSRIMHVTWQVRVCPCIKR